MMLKLNLGIFRQNIFNHATQHSNRNTINGTKRWLLKHGFPDREIISSMNGLEWKAQKLVEMFPEVTRIIDDNVDLLQYISQEYKGRIFLYSHPGPTTSRLEVILCPTWADVEKEVQQFR